jgi:multimeric flavodoxin WrbA
MKIVVINGINHKGNTYTLTHRLVDKLDGEIKEFFLPKDFNEFCLGCATCIFKGESNCPHYEKIKPLVDALIESDLIILDSPVYCMHATGSMFAFLDHLGYMWMAHRPNEAMFKKQAVVLTTCAGAGKKSTIKDMRDSLFYLGVGRIYEYGVALMAPTLEDVKDKKKKKIDKKMNKIAKSITKRNGKVKPKFKTKAFFFLMHLMQKNGYNELDKNHWVERGWTKKNRPWKKKKED